MATMLLLPGPSRLCVLLLLFLTVVKGALEPGRKTFTFTSKENVGTFLKSLYKDAIISISGRCSHKSENPPVLRVSGAIKYGRCAEKMNDLESLPSSVLEDTFESLSPDYQLQIGPEEVNCSLHVKLQEEMNQHQVTYSPPTVPKLKNTESDQTEDNEKTDSDKSEGDEETGPGQSKGNEKTESDQTEDNEETAELDESEGDEESDKENEETGAGQTKGNEKTESDQTEDNEETDSDKSEGDAQAKGGVKDSTVTTTATQSTTKTKSITSSSSNSKSTTATGEPIKPTRSSGTSSTATMEETQPARRKRRSNDKNKREPKVHKPSTSNKAKLKKTSSKGKSLHEEKMNAQQTRLGLTNEKKKISKNPTIGTGKKESESLSIKLPTAKQRTNEVLKIEKDGVYILLIKVDVIDNGAGNSEDDTDFALTLDVSMKNKVGYLSAADWPLLPFYGAMSLLYLTYGIVWLVISACYWRDILRIQFWIGGVIALGMLEKAIFYSEFSKLNHEGYKTGSSLLIFAEIVSCFKRTLARILILIVSMGFGIVRPRLGSTLHKVLGVGFIYFLLATIEGCYRTVTPTASASKEELIARIPLAVLDSAICWWIFMSLVQTTRTLRIRRNTIKLSLYRHFTNTLIFAVLASLAYMIYSIKEHTFTDCIDDWSELWFDEAFWHFLFSLILLVIMILWRPSANNQRYAFTPLVDLGEEDDEDNITLSEAFEGMKLRNTKNPSSVPDVKVNGDSKRTKAEDDLKWVEENIPTSGDIALPSLMDSDEELMTTKFEISKME